LTQNKLNRAAPAESPEFRQLRQALDDLAQLVGLTFVVYDQEGHLLGNCRPNPICSAMQADERGCRLCEHDCGGMLDQVSKGGEVATFKCHASLYSFAAPLSVSGQARFAVLGGRVFRSYQDFLAFAKLAPQFGIKDYFFEDWDNSLRFENSRYFERAVHFLQSMVDSLCRGSSQVDKFKKKSDQLNTLYDLSTVLPETSPEKIHQLVLQAVGVLFDIPGGAIWKAGVDGTRFHQVSTFGPLVQNLQNIQLGEHPGFEDLQSGNALFLEETYPILRVGLPETIHSVHSFPIQLRNRLAWVLQIYNKKVDPEAVDMLQAYCRHLGTILENGLLKREIQESTSVLSVVTDFNRAIGPELESQGLHRAILMKTAELVQAEQASLMIFDDTSQELSIKCVKGLNEKIVQSLRIKPGDWVAGFVFETGRGLLIKNVDDDSRFSQRQRARYRTKSLICVPLKIDQRKIGVINLTDKVSGESFDENDLKLVESIASQASVALDRTDFYKMSEDLRKISITDPLTDLYNRRFFQDRISEEIERARRHSHSVSLIMLDIDNFKNYNDTYGHLAGDEALRLTAGIIKNSVRNIDLVARYGGEEFAVILPVTEILAARDIAERIRSGVASRYFPDDALRAAVKLTASLGIASFPQQADTMLELIGNADKALYMAKITGKNRVALFDKSRATKNASGNT
jgi:diguanylate cyclase (GGDEF)-like protein